MDADPIERIETKIAFLEGAIAEFSDVIFRQHRDIDALRDQLATLTTRLQAYQENSAPRTPQDERPPHY